MSLSPERLDAEAAASGLAWKALNVRQYRSVRNPPGELGQEL